MENEINYRYSSSGEENEISKLINDVFDEFVAPGYHTEGIQEFKKYIEPTAISERLNNRHFCILAVSKNKIIGMIEVRDYYHVSLLFVSKEYMKRGIAKELYKQAISICKENKPELSRIEVNSSPYAITIYEKMGFVVTGPSQTKNGITFIPMEHKLDI